MGGSTPSWAPSRACAAASAPPRSCSTRCRASSTRRARCVTSTGRSTTTSTLARRPASCPPTRVSATTYSTSTSGRTSSSSYEAGLRANVEVVVDLPVDVAHLARRVEEALQRVLQDLGGAEAAAHALDGPHDGVDHVRARLEEVWPDEPC